MSDHDVFQRKQLVWMELNDEILPHEQKIIQLVTKQWELDELTDEAKQQQEKDSDKITIERVELMKKIKNPNNILLVYGYIRINALKNYELDIPSPIIQFIILYTFFLPKYERGLKRIKEQMDDIRAILHEKREKRRIVKQWIDEYIERHKTNEEKEMERLEALERRKIIEIQVAELKRIDVINRDNINGVRYWLKDIVKLEQYLDLFVKHGIERISTVVLLNKEVLNEMGIGEVDHQLLILNEVACKSF